MRALLIGAALSCCLAIPGLAQDPGEPQSETRRDARPEPKQAQQIQQQITDLYISNLKSEVELTDEQFLKLNMALRQFMRMRFQAPAKRQALNQRLEQLLSQPNPADADVQQLNDEIAQHDRETGTLEARFLTRFGSELSPRQQLLLRQFNQKFFNETLPRLVTQARERNTALRGQRQKPAGSANDNTNRPNIQERPGNPLRGKPNATR